MPSPEIIQERVAELNQVLQEESLKLKILPGMEIALGSQIPELIKDARIQPLANSSYILIEPPFQRLPLGWEHVFFGLISKGYMPLLAHAERCSQLADKPKLFEELLSMGIYLQVNWFSFLGHHGSKAQKTASYLACRGYIHCLATDSHRPDQLHKDNLEQASAVVEELVGSKNSEILVRENPSRVLRSEPLRLMNKEEIQSAGKKQRKWRIFKSAGYGKQNRFEYFCHGLKRGRSGRKDTNGHGLTRANRVSSNFQKGHR